MDYPYASERATHRPTPTPSDPAWRRKDLQLSVVLAICVGLVWIYFSG